MKTATDLIVDVRGAVEEVTVAATAGDLEMVVLHSPAQNMAQLDAGLMHMPVQQHMAQPAEPAPPATTGPSRPADLQHLQSGLPAFWLASAGRRMYPGFFSPSPSTSPEARSHLPGSDKAGPSRTGAELSSLPWDRSAQSAQGSLSHVHLPSLRQRKPNQQQQRLVS